MIRVRTPLLLLLGLLFWPACTGNSARGVPTDVCDGVVAFVDVHVVPMNSERVLHGHTVLVRDGRIVNVGPSDRVEIPSEACRIEGEGRYLLPGLTDFHVHLRSPRELTSYLAHGVTSVVHLSGATGSASDLHRLRDEITRGPLLGPMIYSSGSILDGDPPIFAGVSTVVASPEEAISTVADQYEAGYDFVKVYNNLEPDVLHAAVAAAHERGMAVIGHIPRVGGRGQALQRALDSGLDVIAHGEEYYFTYFYADIDRLLDLGEIPHPNYDSIADAVGLTKAAGAAVIPNLSFVVMTRRQLDDLDAVLNDPEARYLHPDVRAMWANQNPTQRIDLDRFDRRERAKYPFVQRLTKALSEADVPLLLGTDSSAPGMYPGKSAHVELNELVAAGLTPFDALATGTMNAGNFIGAHVARGRPFGAVATGHRADLILVDGNPLDDVANLLSIEGVMVRGKWLSGAELDSLRSDGLN